MAGKNKKIKCWVVVTSRNRFIIATPTRRLAFLQMTRAVFNDEIERDGEIFPAEIIIKGQ